MHPFSTPHENVKKPLSFLTFSGGRERVHWEQMGYANLNMRVTEYTIWQVYFY